MARQSSPLAAGLLLLAITSTAAEKYNEKSAVADLGDKEYFPFQSLQGAWNGKRSTGAFLVWDGKNGVFDGGCIRSDERLVHAALGDKRDYKLDFDAGELQYDATMQIYMDTDGAATINQEYVTPTDYADSKSKMMLIAGVGPFLQGFEGRLENFTNRAVSYSVPMDRSNDTSLGCLHWELDLDRDANSVKLRQVEAFRVSIHGDKITMHSDLCAAGEVEEVSCVVDKRPYFEEGVTLDKPTQGATLDPFTYCMWDDSVQEGERSECLQSALFPGLQPGVDEALSSGELNKKGDLAQCFKWYASEHELSPEEVDMCFAKVQEKGRDMLATENKAMQFCEAHVRCHSCDFCSKYGWECLACALNGLFSSSSSSRGGDSSSLSRSDGIFQSGELATGDTLPLGEWADTVDKMYGLPNLEKQRSQQGRHEVANPKKEWNGFLEDVDLSDDNRYTTPAKDAFEALYGPRLKHVVGPYDQLVISATVVTEWECSVGPCRGLHERF